MKICRNGIVHELTSEESAALLETVNDAERGEPDARSEVRELREAVEALVSGETGEQDAPAEQ